MDPYHADANGLGTEYAPATEGQYHGAICAWCGVSCWILVENIRGSEANYGFRVCVLSALRLVTFYDLYYVTDDRSCKAAWKSIHSVTKFLTGEK